MKPVLLPVLLCALIPALPAKANPVIERQLESYRQQGAAGADAVNGERLWNARHGERSCTSCHGATPQQSGRHERTGKAIEPMAVSVNPRRFTDARKIEKWFRRNCQWTFGQECSAQQKADLLTWLASQ